MARPPRLALSLLLLATTLSCRHPGSVVVKPDCPLPPRPDSGAVWEGRGIVYETPGSFPLALDISVPMVRDSASPVVVLVHGGAWREGERTEFDVERGVLAGLGYAAVGIDYRLSSTTVTYPAPLQDIRCALRWVRQNAATYGFNPERVVMLGTSAGAHLAGLAVYAPATIGPVTPECGLELPGAHVVGFVSFYGPSDIRPDSRWPLPAWSFLERFLGVMPVNNPTLAAEASPVTHAARRRGVPALLIHGNHDPIVSIYHSRDMLHALQSSGTPVTMVTVEGAGHGFRLFEPDSAHRPAVCALTQFLHDRLTGIDSLQPPRVP